MKLFHKIDFLKDGFPKSFVQVLRRLLNLGCAGAELWFLYQATETCRHCLSTEVNIDSNQPEDWLISGFTRSCLWLDSRKNVVRGDPSLPSCCVLGQLSKTGDCSRTNFN